MNILAITDESHIIYSLSHSFFPAGINVIHFNCCSDAILQVNEIEPSVIIVDCDTDPRAWKPLIKVIRQSQQERAIVFLLIMSNCDLETANIALSMGVNGIILKPFTEQKSVTKIVKIVKRHIKFDDKRNFTRVKPDIDDSILFMYNYLLKRQVVKGQVTDLSAGGLSVHINTQLDKNEFLIGQTLKNCTLKIRGYEAQFDLLILWNQPSLFGGRFVNTSNQNLAPLYEYLLEKLSYYYHCSKRNISAKLINFNKDEYFDSNIVDSNI